MGILAVASALPSRVVESRELSIASGLPLDFIQSKLGIKERRWLSSGETSLDLAERAARVAMANAQEKVESIFLVTQNPTQRIPHDSALLHGRLDLKSSVACIDLGLACSGYVQGLLLAEAWLNSNEQSGVLLVTADAYSPILDKSDRNTTPLFGDAATATVLAPDGPWKIGRGTWGTLSEASQAISLPGIEERDKLDDSRPSSQGRAERRLRMDGRAVLNAVLRYVPDAVNKTLSVNGLKTADVDFFLFHQASAHMVEQLRKRLSLRHDQVPVNVEYVGNTVSSSIPLLLEPLVEGDMEDAGNHSVQRILLCGFGVGFSWACTVLQREVP